MPHLITRVLKVIYPYWVISKVIVLLLGSLVFLVLHGTMRQLLHTLKLSAKQDLSYVNRAD